MSRKTKKITIPAVMSALSVVFIYLASVFPTGQLGFIAIACLFGIAAVIETGIISGVMVYIVSSVLALLIVPNKLIVLIYVMFFGYYPIVKSLAEHVKSRVVEWIIKLAVVNGALTLMLFTIKEVLIPASASGISTVIIYIVVNIVFIIFDIGVAKLIVFYLNRISKNIR